MCCLPSCITTFLTQFAIIVETVLRHHLKRFSVKAVAVVYWVLIKPPNKQQQRPWRLSPRPFHPLYTRSKVHQCLQLYPVFEKEQQYSNG